MNEYFYKNLEKVTIYQRKNVCAGIVLLDVSTIRRISMCLDEEVVFKLWLSGENWSREIISDTDTQKIRNMFLETLRDILANPSESVNFQTWLCEKKNPALWFTNQTFRLVLGWGLMYNDPLGR